MRHPGIQHQYRMREIADKMTECSGIIQRNFNRIRQLEEEAYKLKHEADEAQIRLNQLKALQTELITAQNVTELGLPSGMTPEQFKQRTGHEITT